MMRYVVAARRYCGEGAVSTGARTAAVGECVCVCVCVCMFVSAHCHQCLRLLRVRACS